MEIRFSVFWKVEVDDHIDGLDIDTTGQEVRTDKITAYAIAEVMEHSITVVLQHLGVGVET